MRIESRPPLKNPDQLPLITQVLSKSPGDTSAIVATTPKPFALPCCLSSSATPYGSLVKSVTTRYLQALISPANTDTAYSKNVDKRNSRGLFMRGHCVTLSI